MHYSTSAVFSITLFVFLCSLVFNNRIENLTLISNNKISGAPYFRGGGGPEAVPLLPAGRAGPDLRGNLNICIVTRRHSLLLTNILSIKEQSIGGVS